MSNLSINTIEIFGIVAIIIMVTSYALEDKSHIFVAIFAVGCACAALYAFLIKSYPFLFAEGIWAVIAFKRWQRLRANI